MLRGVTSAFLRKEFSPRHSEERPKCERCARGVTRREQGCIAEASLRSRGGPRTPTATTGTPAAIASTTARPNGSDRAGARRTPAFASSSSALGTHPTKVTPSNALGRRPRLECDSLRAVADDAHHPALLDEPRRLPRAERRDGVLLGLQPLQYEHRSARATPEARRGRDAVEDHGVWSSLRSRRDVIAHRDLARQTTGDPRREEAPAAACAPPCGEVARRHDGSVVHRSRGHCHSLGEGHVRVADVTPANAMQRAQRLERGRAGKPRRCAAERHRHLLGMPSHHRDVPASVGRLARDIAHVPLDAREVRRRDDVDNARHRQPRASPAERLGPRA